MIFRNNFQHPNFPPLVVVTMNSKHVEIEFGGGDKAPLTKGEFAFSSHLARNSNQAPFSLPPVAGSFTVKPPLLSKNSILNPVSFRMDLAMMGSQTYDGSVWQIWKQGNDFVKVSSSCKSRPHIPNLMQQAHSFA